MGKIINTLLANENIDGAHSPFYTNTCFFSKRRFK